jgi:oligopeptide/dipeptide ABC transporter ATP-binding protein
MNDNVLEIQNLSIDFRTTRGLLKAVRDVNLFIPREKIVGLVGESGCGKSTLAFSIISLLAVNAEIRNGVIGFEGRDILEMSSDDLRALRGDRISMVFQDPMTSINPVLPIGTQMTDIQYRNNISKADKRRRVVEMLTLVGIPDAENRLSNYCHQFSGGMRQRIAIAMALMAEPALLIADEPTTALDATLEAQIIHRLRDLQEKFHCSILYVSHNLGVIAELCDNVVVMYAGEVIEEGTARDIFHHASHPYTKALVECDPARIEQKTRNLPTIPGGIPDLVNLPDGCIFKNRCPSSFERCQENLPSVFHLSVTHFAKCFLLDSGDDL